MAYFKQIRPTQVGVITRHNIDYLCAKVVAILSEHDLDYPKLFEEMNEPLFQALTNGLGRELYVQLRVVISKHLQKMHQNLTASFLDGHESGDKLFNTLFRQWSDFSERLVILRQILLNLESVLESSVGEESLVVFAWRTYRSILMDNNNSVIVPKLLLNIIETPTEISKEEQKMFVVDGGDQQNDEETETEQKRSVFRRSLFSNDTLYDFLRCVDTATLGLSVALCCRRFANFADFILRRRAHSNCALMLFDGQNQMLCAKSKAQSSDNVFAVRLWDSAKANIRGRGFERRIYANGMTLYKVIDQWFCNPIEQKALELSEFEVPEWITGIRFLYLLDVVSPPVLSFLRQISPMLEKCCLKFELTSFWSKLHSSGQLLPFLSLFNPLTFSLHLTFDDLYFHSVNRPNPYFFKLPFWAIFQGIFFPNCHDLSIPICLLSSREIGIDVALWLHNKRSDTECPSRIVLSDYQKGLNSMGKSFGQGLNAMVGLIKERFAEDLERRHFIVESPFKLVNSWDERFLTNGNGECLLISPNRIVRCSNGNEHAKFEQFHKHLAEGAAEKEPTATVQFGTNDSVRWLKEVMAKMERK
ncbi:hypothetical protein niasHT_015587 [Heterodera trifolii]|uniref:Cullin N-terminal domain-containing protein n=1 Tax=Heterodera trifolii TaxID=157864 RepID=A0ABD2LCF2_9BILA